MSVIKLAKECGASVVEDNYGTHVKVQSIQFSNYNFLKFVEKIRIEERARITNDQVKISSTKTLPLVATKQSSLEQALHRLYVDEYVDHSKLNKR